MYMCMYVYECACLCAYVTCVGVCMHASASACWCAYERFRVYELVCLLLSLVCLCSLSLAHN
jgi:hypothetical protein